jgi:hypothetical protein
MFVADTKYTHINTDSAPIRRCNLSSSSGPRQYRFFRAFRVYRGLVFRHIGHAHLYYRMPA